MNGVTYNEIDETQNNQVELELDDDEFDVKSFSDDDEVIEEKSLKNKFIASFRISHYAQDMSLWRAVTLVVFAFFFSWTTSLLITGFQGLYPVLIKEGVYAHLCEQVQPKGGVGIPIDSKCTKQTLKLNLMFTITVSALNLVCFPVGYMIDRFGPKWIGLGGSISTVSGSIMFAFSSRRFDMFIPGYMLIGIGGAMIFMSLLHTTNIFPAHRGFVASLLTAAEDSSTGVFYFFRKIHETGISMRTLFIGYSIIPIIHLLAVYLQPKKPVRSEKNENGTKEFYFISEEPITKQIKSFTFWAIVVWNCVCTVAGYFYISTLNKQIIWLFDSDALSVKASEIFSLFFIIFPFLAVPLNGWVLNRFGTWQSLILNAFMFLIYGVISVIPYWPIQYVAFAVFVICRASYIGTCVHLINLMFGQNFTTLIGVIWTIGGLSTLSNHLAVYIVLDRLKGQFLGANIIYTILAFTSSVILAFIVNRQLSTKANHLIPLEDMIPIQKEEI